MGSITAKDISDLLLQKYSEKFVCVPECKVGSAWMMNRCSVIDFWCMAKSWTKPRTIAFEIKVNRQDFLRDDKWPVYLKYCTEFYFVAPPGVIDTKEVPDQAGLLVSSKNAKVLYTKKKAPVRNVKIPDSIYRYILMWRSQITDKNQLNRSQSDYWRKWLARKDEDKRLGHRVSRKIRQIVKDRIHLVETRNGILKSQNEKLQKIKDILDSLGITHALTSYNPERDIHRALNEINSGISDDFLKMLLETSKKLKLAHGYFESKANEGL